MYQARKPDKIRVVFDCSAHYQDTSLNDHLLSGPDLTNTLIGVLCRFRQESIRFICDVEQMFFQFQVNPEHRNYLRFLWWENGDLNTDPVTYRMKVHLFGAVSSPGCANFGLKRIATDYEDKYGSSVANFIRRDFYVDDGLKSVPTVDDALTLISDAKKMCSEGGLKLHKFVSHSKEVLEAIPQDERSTGLKNLDLQQDVMPVEAALGMHWNIEVDSFTFRLTLKDTPLTRRGIMSTISSIYDPLGFLAPVLLHGRQILQKICREHSNWDDPVSDEVRAAWERWRNDLIYIERIQIGRCYKPRDFGLMECVELHHFSDASQDGYGQCSYLRFVNNFGRVHCSLVMGKSRVTPTKLVTIPRLELTAALLSVKVSSFIGREL